jgi:hypothetical protein
LIVQKLDDGKVVINLKKCGKCNQNIIELFKAPIRGSSFEDLLYEIMQDKSNSLKVEFDGFSILCPSCGEAKKDISYLELEEKEVKMLNETPISNIFVTVNPI